MKISRMRRTSIVGKPWAVSLNQRPRWHLYPSKRTALAAAKRDADSVRILRRDGSLENVWTNGLTGTDT